MTVNCPNCGRPNPDEAYICQFCDTPLVSYTPPQIPKEDSAEEPPREIQEGSPEWLEQLRRKKEEDANKYGDDFFNRFGPVENVKSDQPAPESEGLDDWLSKVRSNLEMEGSAGNQEVEPDAALPGESSTSDWLSTIRQKANQDGYGAPTPNQVHDGEEWLVKLRKQTGPLKPIIEENPAWMKELNEPHMPPPPFLDDSESHADLADTYIEDENEPDFIQHLNELPEITNPPEPEPFVYHPPAIPNETEHPIPEMLRNSIPQIDAESLSEDSLPSEEEMLEMQDEPREKIPSKDIPNWLTSILGESEAEAAPLSAVAAGPVQEPEPEVEESFPVEPGKIPGWVQAMRPIEPASFAGQSQKETDRTQAESGPLAGIRGILPGETLLPTYTPSSGFNISMGDKKKTAEHISIFNEILAIESQTVKTLSIQKTKTAGTIRWLMMLMLFLLILIPVMNSTGASSLPGSIPRETMGLFKSITELPADSKVIVAVDYEPAYAGELQAAAGAVLNHLMVKQSNLYVVSTSPTGPLLANQLIYSLNNYPQTFQGPYTSGEKFHILGFIPGGQAGIQALNTSVTNAIPLTIDLTKSVEIPGLSGPSPIQTFNAILIISDQPDTIRYWLEQVNRTNNQPAIWAVTNAQSAPMLRPYVRSGQLEGLSAGEYGGALYERIFQQPGIAWRHWNIFHTAILSAVVLILVGGILNYSGQLLLRNRRKKSS